MNGKFLIQITNIFHLMLNCVVVKILEYIFGEVKNLPITALKSHDLSIFLRLISRPSFVAAIRTPAGGARGHFVSCLSMKTSFGFVILTVIEMSWRLGFFSITPSQKTIEPIPMKQQEIAKYLGGT